MVDKRIVKRDIFRYKSEEIKEVEDVLIIEAPLTIYFNEKELVTLLCTPDYTEELALGFLVSEGLVKNIEDLNNISYDSDKGAIWINSSKNDTIAEKLFLKRYITTGCGKGTSFFNVMDSALIKPFTTDFKISPQEITSLMRKFQNSSQMYKDTGGVHSSGLCTKNDILIFREDIGRHNAVDKIVGESFKQKIVLDDKLLITSGRVSSEILLKIAKMGISTLISRSAPTDYAVRLAQDIGVTVIGFVRGERFNIYSHKDRVQGA